MDTGTILMTEPIDEPEFQACPLKVALYTRVSAAENQDNWEGQAKRLQAYGAAKGYPIAMVVKEMGSGVNETRPQLLQLLNDPSVTLIVVAHKERLTRFGFHSIEQLLKMQNRRIEVIHPAENGKEDLGQDRSIPDSMGNAAPNARPSGLLQN